MEPLLRQLEHRPLHHQIDDLEVQKIKEAIDEIVASSK
jgi:hypothetical protein